MNKNDLFILLNIPADDSIDIDDVHEDNGLKHARISRKVTIQFCPDCHARLHSKGLKHRTVKHPIYQDGTFLILHVEQRRWTCPCCRESFNEEYPFLDRYAHSSKLTALMVLNALKDLNRSTVSVAEQFGLSDSCVHDMFSKYVDLKRLELSEYISIDEVYLDINSNSQYAFVIMNFVTGEIIDIVHNRWSNTLEDYFISIPIEERRKVKAIISDAYGPYQNLTKFFPNSEIILDSFHVVKFIINRINAYIYEIYKKYRKIQMEKLRQNNELTNKDNKTIQSSLEMILLKEYKWVLLKNQDDIIYSYRRYYHKKLKMYVDTYQVEKMFLDLDSKFIKIRELKEKYIKFNSSSYSSVDEIEETLDGIIDEYSRSEFVMFRDFSSFLKEFKPNIIKSFTTVACTRKTKKDQEDYYSRLSNGPMESFNRKPKDYKRNARGFSNFDYTRNRILWSTRNNPSVLAIPKTTKQIHSYHKKKKDDDK